MKFTVNAAKIIEWIETDIKNHQNPTLSYIKDQTWYKTFFDHNRKVFDAVMDRRMQILTEHFELDEHGNVRQEQKIKEIVEKGRYFWLKETKKKVPDGSSPVFKEGKTMESFQKEMQEFMQSQHEVSTKPQIYSKFPIVANL